MRKEQVEELCETIYHASRSLDDNFTSNALFNAKMEKANVADVIGDLSFAARAIASAITPASTSGGKDANGGHVASLTEAVMGVTGGLCRIAEAINNLAEAVREKD